MASDERLLLETSSFNLFTVTNLRYQLIKQTFLQNQIRRLIKVLLSQVGVEKFESGLISIKWLISKLTHHEVT